nr:ABC transporter permease subunit [Geodermatophilaceae bacterium]
SLLRVELARLRARRLIRAVVVLALLAGAVGVVVALFVFGPTTPAVLADAEQRRDADLVMFEEFRQECLADIGSTGADPESFCGPEATTSDLELQYYLAEQPFTLLENLPNGALAVGLATAVLGFVVGATFVGAEWSARSMVALLFWEPRRMRVILAKTAVAAGFGLVLAAVGQLLWLGVGTMLAAVRGNDGEMLPTGYWSDLVGQSGRAVLLGLIATLFGFGVANLVRNTGAAFGAGFLYFAVVETALRIVASRSQPFLLSDSALAFLLPGGLSLFRPGPMVDEGTGAFQEFSEYVVGNVRGGVTLGVYLAVLLAVGFWLFRRRDLH